MAPTTALIAAVSVAVLLAGCTSNAPPTPSAAAPTTSAPTAITSVSTTSSTTTPTWAAEQAASLQEYFRRRDPDAVVEAWRRATAGVSAPRRRTSSTSAQNRDVGPSSATQARQAATSDARAPAGSRAISAPVGAAEAGEQHRVAARPLLGPGVERGVAGEAAAVRLLM